MLWCTTTCWDVHSARKKYCVASYLFCCLIPIRKSLTLYNASKNLLCDGSLDIVCEAGEERRGDCLIRHSLASWNRIWGKRTPIPSFPDHGSHYFLQAANKSRPCDLQKWKKKKRSTCCLDWCWREGWAAWQRRLNQDSPPDRISLDGQTAPIWLDTEFF